MPESATNFSGSTESLQWIDHDKAIVCLIRGPNRPVGTGFLVGPNLILTCYHVYYGLSDLEGEDETIPYDGFKDNIKSNIENSRCWVTFEGLPPSSTKKTVFFSTGVEEEVYVCGSPIDELDYAVLKLSESVGEEEGYRSNTLVRRNWIRLFEDTLPNIGDEKFDIQFVHYPAGAEQAYSLGQLRGFVQPSRRNLHLYEHDQSSGDLRHNADSYHGSSGAPCRCAHTGKVAALHKGQLNASGEKRAIPITLIREDIERKGYRDLLNRAYDSASLPDYVIRTNLENEIYQEISGKIDIRKIEQCYLAVLPERSNGLRVKSENEIRAAINDLMMNYGGNMESCLILDFLQLLRATEETLRYPLSTIVDRVCLFYKIHEDAKTSSYQRMRTRAESVYSPDSLIVLMLKPDESDPGRKNYKLTMKKRKAGKQGLDVIMQAEIRDQNHLTSVLTKSWVDIIEDHIEINQCIIIYVPRELLVWDIDRIKFGNDQVTFSTLGHVTYVSHDRFHSILRTRSNKWKERWNDIADHARVVNIARNRPDDNSVLKGLRSYKNKNGWVSCLVEGKNEDPGKKELEWLLETGVPAMVWVRGEYNISRNLLPRGDFNQQEVLRYPHRLWDSARKKGELTPNPIAYLCDNPDYEEEGIV